MSTLKEKYAREVVPALKEKLKVTNPLRVPRLVKVVINMGIGAGEKEAIPAVTADLTKISGQKPVMTKARKSISNFKVREGMIVGAKVTLRGVRMYEFLERLICAALPRIRDFRGLSPRGFDGRGNFTMGVKEQTIFPEVDANTATAVQGMDITIVTTARTNDEARELLKLMGVPFAAN